MRRLIAAGADINFTTRICHTAYDQARTAVFKASAAPLPLLVSLGADPLRAADCNARAQRGGAAARVELDAQEAVVVAWRRAVSANDFAALEAMFAPLKGSADRTPSGLVKRAILFHQMVVYAYRRRDPAYWAELEPQVAAWHRALPRSLAARLFQVNVRFIRVNSVRGDGDWPDVPPVDLAESRRLALEAMAWLEEVRPLAGDEPEWDVARLNLLPYVGSTPAQSLEEGLRAIDRHPGYLPLVTTAAWYVDEDWHGSRAMVERIVRENAARAPASEGRASYARAYWYLDDNQFHGALFTATDAKWSDMKAGFEDMIAVWPAAWNLNAYARFACLAHDVATLRPLLARIGDDVVLQVWGKDDGTTLARCRAESAAR